MTTAVEIRANHGWPVRVTLLQKPMVGQADIPPQYVVISAGEKRTMYIHSHLDLIIHEIQPEELGGTVKPTDVVEAEVVQQRTVTGYIEPITADKLNL